MHVQMCEYILCTSVK